jgi:hypothetical protein
MANRDSRYQFVKELGSQGLGGREERWYKLVFDEQPKKYLIEVELDYVPHSGAREHSYSYHDVSEDIRHADDARLSVQQIHDERSAS